MKILKPVLSYIAILFCSIIIMGAIMFLLFSIVDNVVWLIWVSSGVIVAIAILFILLYVKNKKFNNFIKKHKNVFHSGSFIGAPFGIFIARTGIFHDHITNPILWNWIIGSVLVLFIILTIVYYTKYIKIKDDNLKLQIEPHTIRNIIEDMIHQIFFIFSYSPHIRTLG